MEKTTRIKPPAYSYHKFKSEDRKIYKKMAIIFAAMIVIILVLWFWGVSFVQLLGGLNLNNDSGTNGITLPIQKPNLSDIPEFTNKETLTIAGNTTPKVQVTLFVNGSQNNQTTTDTNGNFTFVDVKLKEGLNVLKVTAKDKAGQSEDEVTSTTYDKVAPKLAVSQPSDNQSFSQDTKTIQVIGTSDEDSSVFVNSIQTTTGQNGSFSYNLNLSPGENKIEVKAVDKANNETTIELTVTVS